MIGISDGETTWLPGTRLGDLFIIWLRPNKRPMSYVLSLQKEKIGEEGKKLAQGHTDAKRLN